MTLTADISMYPNREEFIPPIDGFIARINQYEGLAVKTFPTSTVVQGPYDLVMRAVHETMAACHAEFGMAVYVCKFIPGYSAL
ncbi:MAG: hypothetical protein JJ896_15990 [Rhodothermales bacterium]|nr:hypothetical protein [Rhodothermales bacterium]MBO6781156.1 hypothetical protein [Rhodothermales bacterium]